MTESHCHACGASEWWALPDPAPDRSITTAGLILDRPLAKAQCARCGFVQRTRDRFVGESDYYAERYASYYARPGATTYDAERYRVMAEWIGASIANSAPAKILDVGCGAGWAMDALRRVYPAATIEGIEPSIANAEAARGRGLSVRTGTLDEDLRPSTGDDGYDLVYSINVLQHVLDPVAFLRGIAERLHPRGRAVLILPDATRPTNEILWADHNFSFEPRHVATVADRAGLAVVGWSGQPQHISILDKQLVVLARADIAPSPELAKLRHPEDSFADREAYLREWSDVRARLRDATVGFRQVANFGASMWTFLLAGYASEYWGRVDYCVVDGFAGTCLDKTVRPFAADTFSAEDCIVLGVHPRSQPALEQRLAPTGSRVIAWADCVPHDS